MARLWLAVALLVSSSALARAPRLTLFVSVDSMSSEVFQRMRPKFKGGFQQLLAQGAYFPTAQFDFAENRTAPGHATLATGANPWRHGLVGNLAFNRATGRFEPVLADPSHPVLEAPLSADDTSPINLMAETVSDRVRLSTQERGKSIAIAGKARASIAMGGRLGQAWWYSTQVGKFVTGTYYAKEFPDWVKAFNEKKPGEAWFGKEWTLSLKPAEYLGEDDRPFEADEYGLGRTFPHPINGRLPAPGPQFHSALSTTPYLNELIASFAKEAIVGEQLGRDDVPDVLWVGFSAIDTIYHHYGPYSWEAQDAYVKLDRTLQDLIAAATRAAGGRDNLLVVVSADHGGAAVPEEWAAAGLPASRVNTDAIAAELNRELKARFGIEPVSGIEETDVYLNAKAIEDKKLDGAMVRRAVASMLAQRPQILLAVARDDLWGPDPTGQLARVRKGFFPERSGDVLMLVKEYQVITDAPNGTSHGTPYSYDAHVPFLLAGRGVRAGTYRAVISTVDIAATVATLLEVGLPAEAEGSARAEALDPGK